MCEGYDSRFVCLSVNLSVISFFGVISVDFAEMLCLSVLASLILLMLSFLTSPKGHTT